MKKTIFIFILITVILFCGCTYQNSAKNTSSFEMTAQETDAKKSVEPSIIKETTAPANTVIPTITACAINPTAPLSIVIPNPRAIFTLTKEDFEKLKAPLTVLATANENPDLIYDLKNGLSKKDFCIYAWYIAYYFEYFYPKTSIRYFETDKERHFETLNEKYGIKKGDLYIDNKYFVHIPQKAINSILMSTFGEEALEGIHLNQNIFDGFDVYGPKELKDGIYIFGPIEYYPEENVLGPLDLPFKGNENTEFTTNYKVTYTTVPPDTVNYSIQFKLRKDATSEWGYNITAFNMQRDE